MRPLKADVHAAVYFFGLLVFAAAIPLSNYVMSLAQWILVANFFIDRQVPAKLKRILNSPAALLLIGIWMLHLVGLLWSQDVSYGLKDLRVKLPLLIVPFVMAGENTLPAKRFRQVLTIHALAVLAGSFVILYQFIFRNVSDPRDASILISHIRFALNICLALFTTAYLLWKERYRSKVFLILRLALVVWLFLFLFILQSFTGLAVFGLTALCGGLYFGISGRSRRTKIITATAIVITLAAAISWSVSYYHHNLQSDPVNKEKLTYYTAHGNLYTHNIHNFQAENGHSLWLYVCYDELRAGWAQRSQLPFDSLDKKGQPLHYTLIRYMTSRGLRKDLAGMDSLSHEEIRAVENGVTNMKDLGGPNFLRRVETVLWELADYQTTGDPTHHSLMQRVELWKAACSIIGENPWIGIGTGDVPSAMKAELERTGSPLKDAGMRSHNQFLTVALALGIPALLYFLFVLIFVPLRASKFRNFVFFTFFMIALLSMLTEDTLESQPGISFFIFFYMLLLIGEKGEAPDGSPKNNVSL